MNRSVLLVSNFLSSTLTPGVADALARELRAAGWRVSTTSSRENKLARILDMVATIWRTRRDYAVAQIDVYGTLAFVWAEAACATLRLARKPYVLTLHGGQLPDLGRRWPRRVRRLLDSAVSVTVPSRYLLERMKPYRADLRLLPNALDVERYPFRLRRSAAPRLMWIRSFHHLYNPTLAVRTLAILRRDVPDARLTMVGPDKGDGSHAATGQIVRDAELDAVVELPGLCAKSEVPSWLDRGDIFLNTTHADNTPVSVIEAMACGLPVVSTNVGGLPYLLEHEHDALLVPPDDPQAMAAAVRRLVDEPDLAERLSANARRKVERFDWSIVRAEWLELLEATASGEPSAVAAVRARADARQESTEAAVLR